MDCSWLEGLFENLKPGDYEGKSVATPNYNCIAWAANKTDQWWWPVNVGGYYWPPELPREPIGAETLLNFIRAFELQGYELCDNPDREIGFEKVALYAGPMGNPLHAARQLETGVWSSKIGNGEDIEHKDLAALEGNEYGTAVRFLKRKRQPSLPASG
jgi:hypothetical protein